MPDKEDEVDPAMMYGSRWRRGGDDEEIPPRPFGQPTVAVTAGIKSSKRSQVISIGGQKAVVPTMDCIEGMESQMRLMQSKMNELVVLLNQYHRDNKKLQSTVAELEKRARNPYGD